MSNRRRVLPAFKVYSASGEWLAACRYVDTAAALLAVEGEGSTIRVGHGRIVYVNGLDGDAAESYDAVRDVVLSRY